MVATSLGWGSEALWTCPCVGGGTNVRSLLSLRSVVSAAKANQLSFGDGPCRWSKVVPRRLVLDRNSRWGWSLWLFQWERG